MFEVCDLGFVVVLVLCVGGLHVGVDLDQPVSHASSLSFVAGHRVFVMFPGSSSPFHGVQPTTLVSQSHAQDSAFRLK